MPEIILASTSPFRRELLTRLAIPFQCAAPDIDETRFEHETAEQMVKRLALAKAQAVQTRLGMKDTALIIGSDQCAILDNDILGKPHTHEKATQQLTNCSGKTLIFLTSLCLLDTRTQEYQLDVIPFQVTFRHLNTAQIENYLRYEQPYQCAGSFKAEGLGISLFAKMQGDDPSALIGLPLIRLVDMLQQQHVTVPSTNPHSRNPF